MHTMSEHHDYLVFTGFKFGGRHITVKVEDDGFSYWMDDTSYRKTSHESGLSGIDAMVGDEGVARKMRNIRGEHTIKVEVPAEGFREIRDVLSPAYWAEADDADIDKRLDGILEPLFWEHVNPYLSPPYARP
jgi:hypothetical protein